MSFYAVTICNILFIFIIVSGFLNWVDLSFVLMNSKQIFVHYVVRLEKLNGKTESSIFFFSTTRMRRVVSAEVA